MVPYTARSGGQVVDQTTHLIHLARLFAGEITDISAIATRRRAGGDGDVDDVSVATLRFEDGALGTLASTLTLAWPDRIGLHVIADGLSFELSEHDLVVRDGSDPVYSEVAVNACQRQDRAFLDALAGKPADIRATYREALLSHLDAIAVRDASIASR